MEQNGSPVTIQTSKGRTLLATQVHRSIHRQLDEFFGLYIPIWLCASWHNGLWHAYVRARAVRVVVIEPFQLEHR